MSRFASVILPLAINDAYTYEIPDELEDIIQVGSRVEVQFGRKKLYAGIVHNISEENPTNFNVKPILSALDTHPIMQAKQLALWDWMASYYMCSMGEILLAGLPSGLKLASETVVVKEESAEADAEAHSDEEFLLLEALEFQSELTLLQVQQIIDKKTVFPLINKMLQKNLIRTKEELNQKYKPKIITTIQLVEAYKDDISLAVQRVEKFEKQVDCLLAYIQLSQNFDYVTKGALIKKADIGYSTITSLVKKEILIQEERVVSRLGDFEVDDLTDALPDLNSIQVEALALTEEMMIEKDVILMHGVTGSGKTRLYIELIKKALDDQKQILYLLPEIALTNHFIHRLRGAFGEAVTTYHSKLGPNQRTEVYQRTGRDVKILVGPRSAVLLPFHNLGLIIVDESHDYSYKQQDPAPRYHGRDAAIVLARFHKAKVILGTATPAIESYFNAKIGKYGYVTLQHRVRELNPPEMKVYAINNLPANQMEGAFSQFLINKIKENYQNGRQSLIFRNRRGYSPVLKCEVCNWCSECIHCDVSLTYHKSSDTLRCHYCGYRKEIVKVCPDCGNTKLQLKGSGTQKLEESLQLLIPEAKVDRLDADTAAGKARMLTILRQFQSGETDVLIGTQMITKGLDFENVGLVGVVLADALLYFPDFRSEERAHQILSQVGGRAGRTYDKSQVVIQTYQPKHHIFKSLTWEGQQQFMDRVLKERRQYHYPPFVRFVRIQFFHKEFDTVIKCSQLFVDRFVAKSNMIVLGPVANPVKRIRSKYIINCVIKSRKNEKDRQLLKYIFNEVVEELNQEKWSRSVRLSVNVDPY